MRCFVGVPVTGSLARECKELSLGLPRATPRPNLHLTLAFLGQCTPAGVARLSGELQSLAGRFPAFELDFDCCEAFPAEQGPFLALTTTVSGPLNTLHEALWGMPQSPGRRARTASLSTAHYPGKAGAGIGTANGALAVVGRSTLSVPE